MEPRTLRRIGNLCLVFGVAGLACTLIIAGLAVTGTMEPPGFSSVLLAIQSAVNIAVGWTLRRQAASSAG